jgi:hypothetical protein
MPSSKFRQRRERPQFTIDRILAWADAFHDRTGRWPNPLSGTLDESLDDNWRKVDDALRYGLRGLEGGSSLARLLAEHRGVRNLKQLPAITPRHILAWTDAHYERTGSWPNSTTGDIPEAPGETWRAVDQGLRVGVRGLAGGSSLARFLAEHRGVRNVQSLPRFSEAEILGWSDAHYQRTGSWPTSASGPIVEAPGETWKGVAAALVSGRRGLPGGSSLPRLLAGHRSVRNPRQLPPLRIKQIRAWAQAHRRRTGRLPTRASGPITEAPGETWAAVHAALATGCRGLPGGLTLARLLEGQSVPPRHTKRPRLTVPKILKWADAFYTANGAWPHSRSGPINGVPNETWRTVDQALRNKLRGLTEGMTLVQLLTAKRALRTRQYAPTLSVTKILKWARAHFEKTGSWPNSKSGPVRSAPGETWRGVDEALRRGARGLHGNISLAKLLAVKRGVRNRTSLPPLKLQQILTWARAHHQRTGSWPHSESGPIHDAPDETWKGIDQALRGGYRGLQASVTLAQLLADKCGARNRTNLPQLRPEQILIWARAYRRRTGDWPDSASGPVLESPGDTWRGVDVALRQGHRGLPGGSSLNRLLPDR